MFTLNVGVDSGSNVVMSALHSILEITDRQHDQSLAMPGYIVAHNNRLALRDIAALARTALQMF